MNKNLGLKDLFYNTYRNSSIKTDFFTNTNNTKFPYINSFFNANNSKIIQLSIPIATLCIMVFMFIHNNTQGSTTTITTDSMLTELIVEKEMNKLSNKTSIQNIDELKQIAENKNLGFAFYRIKPGENLSSVAQKFGLTMATVLSLNSLDNAHSLTVGQRVLLSTRSGILFNSKETESIESIAKRYGISEKDIITANELSNDQIDSGKTLFLPEANLSFKAMADLLGFQFITPVPKYRRVSSHYGWRRHPILGVRKLHTGIDFAAPTGTPIVAAKEGRVVYADWNGGYGLVVRIRHNNGFETTYAHMSKIRTTKGAWIKSGERVGDVGSTGRSTGAHLHFEIRKYGQAKNPVYQGLQIQ
ncbi:MAG: peptidoglycan DD-metalloendopeptidase family protein [Brevinemataceae bacterium]